MNLVIFSGRIGQKKVSATQAGEPVVNLRVAHSEKYKGEEHTTWKTCVFFGKRAETVAQYFDVGDPISVTGSLRDNEWTDKSGTKHITTEINCRDFEFMPTAKEKSASQANSDAPAMNGQYIPQGNALDDFDDSTPF